jgi:enediyne biosynthesis thioesterase
MLDSMRHREAAPFYRYRHIVGLSETNVVGNVYFSHYVAWQGRCREMFLREHAPDVVAALRGSLRLITLRCGCQYFAELAAFEELEIRLMLRGLQQNRIAMEFDYFAVRAEQLVLAARGDQEIACMQLEAGGLRPCPVPPSLVVALQAYRVS